VLVIELYNYWIVIVLMMVGLYTVISRGNLVKKMVGLNIFQTSVFILFISIGKVADGTPPILLHDGAEVAYANPLPHVLILTAIVVGVATTAVGLALVVRIREAYGSIEEDDIHAVDEEEAL
jgi:multicomponent Na+:H+ antiporter subunit C